MSHFFTETDLVRFKLKNHMLFECVVIDLIERSGSDLKIYFRLMLSDNTAGKYTQYVYFSDILSYKVIERKYRIIQ